MASIEVIEPSKYHDWQKAVLVRKTLDGPKETIGALEYRAVRIVAPNMEILLTKEELQEILEHMERREKR